MQMVLAFNLNGGEQCFPLLLPHVSRHSWFLPRWCRKSTGKSECEQNLSGISNCQYTGQDTIANPFRGQSPRKLAYQEGKSS